VTRHRHIGSYRITQADLGTYQRRQHRARKSAGMMQGKSRHMSRIRFAENAALLALFTDSAKDSAKVPM